MGSCEETKATCSGYDMGAETKADDRRLHLNEFRYGHHPNVLLSAFCSPEQGERAITEYPRGATPGLLKALSGYCDLPQEHFFVSAGSDEALRGIALYCARRGMARAVGGVPTYTHFVVYAEQAGLEWTPVMMGLDATRADRKALIELHDEELSLGALVYLVSPNNPTGATWSADVVAEWAKKYPKSLFIVDEAYIEFLAAELNPKKIFDFTTCSLAHLTLDFQNVIVTRTFSKAFGLAGMRIGYGIAHPALVAKIAAFVSPKSVTAAAMACAEACLAPDALLHYAETTHSTIAEREKIREGLRARGWRVEEGGGNFALVFVGRDSPAVVARLRALGVHVRDRGDLPGLDGYVRVSSGTRDDTTAVLAAFGEFKKEERVQDYYTPAAAVVKLRQMLARARDVLNRSGLPAGSGLPEGSPRSPGPSVWWICEGTLLGALRHGGMLPWDDDIDLGYIFTGEDPFEKLTDDFRRVGLTLQRNRTNAYWQLGENEPGTVISPQHIDIFPYHLDAGSGLLVNADPRFRVAAEGPMCNTSYKIEELFPITPVMFYADMLPAPVKATAVLDRALGKDWRTRAVVRVPGSQKSETFIIKDFSPA